MRAYIKRLFFVVPVLLVATVLAINHSGASPTPAFTYYDIPTPGSTPFSIAEGPDGAMWFTESSGNKIGHINGDGSISEYALPNANSDPKQIVAGPDGAMWFTEDIGNRIGRIAMDGTITEYAVPDSTGLPTSITSGPDGNLWFTEPLIHRVGKVTPEGSVTTYAGFGSYWITSGPDNGLWTTVNTQDQIVRYDTNGSYTNVYSTSRYADPVRITNGPDGALWFTEGFSSGDPSAGNKIGRMTVSGQLAEYPFPESGMPSSISDGPNDSLWTTWSSPLNSNRIFAVSTSGTFTDYTNGQPFGYLGGITHDTAGHLWFTDRDHNQIVMMNPDASSTPPPAAVPTTVTLTPTAGVEPVDGNASFEATVTDKDAQPVPGVTVRFAVTGSDELDGLCVTDTAGQCSYGYTGPNMPGADSVTAYADTDDNAQMDTGEPVASATQAWTLPVVTAGQAAGGGQLAGTDGVHQIAFGFTAKSDAEEVKGNCQLVDQANNLNMHCQSLSALTISGNTASIFGTATINQGTDPVAFRIDVTDNGEPGTTDVFKFTTSVGYSAEGTLDSGNIQLKQ
jgi:virginiamycin B lyase